ncbi:FcoT family thioesterase [Nanoarchaeota archaeon]
MKIEQANINRLLSMYIPKHRYLTEFEHTFPTTTGTFKIPNPDYTSLNIHYFTAIEAQYCLNQLGYASLWASLTNKNIPDFPELDFRKIQQGKTLAYIQEQDITFRQMISTQTPIEGTLVFQGWFPGKKYHKVICNFDFEEMSCYGRLKIAIGPLE